MHTHMHTRAHTQTHLHPVAPLPREQQVVARSGSVSWGIVNGCTEVAHMHARTHAHTHTHTHIQTHLHPVAPLPREQQVVARSGSVS